MALRLLKQRLGTRIKTQQESFRTLCSTLLARPLQSLLYAIGLGLIAISVLAFIKSPGIQFTLTVDTLGLDMRLSGNGDTVSIGGIIGQRLVWEEPDQGNDTYGDDILAFAEKGVTSHNTLATSSGGLVHLDQLVIPDQSVLTLRLLKGLQRTSFLELEISELPAGTEPVAVVVSDPQITHRDTPRQELSSQKYQLFHPELETGAVPPFQISGLRMIRQTPSKDALYPVSLIETGSLEFFSMNRSLNTQTINAGDMLLFEGLTAEVNVLSIHDDTLRLRIFGTAKDVKWGAGSAIASIYPTALDGLTAHPLVRLLLGTISGIMLALIGAVAGRSRP